jgi:hypothetical protein
MTFYAPENRKYAVIKKISAFGGRVMPYHFVSHGLTSWTIQ